MPSRPDPEPELRFDRPWFPGLAERLVEPALAARGISVADYSTQAWLTGDVHEPERGGEHAPLALLQAPPPGLTIPYAALGLTFAGPPSAQDKALFQSAWAWLERVPDAATAVATLVRAVHLLRASGSGYDVSHSDPGLPCTIFLSLPVGEPYAALRAAESILHEAMHLQLTLLEAVHPLVHATASTHYSPWQDRQRPISGVVHGLYVFTAIEAYLAELLMQADLPEATATFAKGRRTQIDEEISAVAQVGGHEDLAPFGRRFVEGLLAARRGP